MKVSVIIPVYNKASYIKETIDSVINQTHKDLEIIIVDDGSSDGTQEIIKSFQDSRILFVQNETNLGTAGIGNKMMVLANCEYVVRHDGDDIMFPTRVADQLEFMEKHPDIIGSSGHLACFGRFNEVWKQPLTHDEIWAKVLFKCPIIQGASIIRKSAWTKYNFQYDVNSKNLGEDWLLWFKIGLKGKLGNIDKEVIKYRLEENNLTQERNQYYFDSRKYLYTEIFKILELPLEYVDIHILTKPEFNGVPTKTDLIKLFKWLDELKAINEKRNLFKKDIFEKEILEKKNKLFYFLMDKNSTLFKTYFKLNRGVTFGQFKYYLRSRKKNK